MSDATSPSSVIGLANGSLSLSIARQGLHLTRLLVTEVGATQGKTHDILPGPEHFVGKRNFEHCIVGRTCNRLPAGEIKLPSGGTASPQAFPPSNPKASLHGGPDGWDRRDWSLLDPKNATLFTASERKTIASQLPSPQSQMFTLTSPDGDGGYPGEVKAEVLYAVTEGDETSGSGSVIVVYRAALVGKEGTEETPVNLTQHWGFNLDASLGGPSPTSESASVRDHVLTLASSNTLTLDPKTALSTGTLTSSVSQDSPHNHREGKKIAERYPKDSPSGGYDDFYLFDDRAELNSPSNPTTFPEDELTSADSQDFIAPLLKSSKPTRTVASLSSAKSPISLSFSTNQQGVQLYTAPGGGSSERKKVHGGAENDTTGYGKEYACFLEFHAPYATYLHPELEKEVGGFNTLLKRGQVYNNFARMDIQLSS